MAFLCRTIFSRQCLSGSCRREPLRPSPSSSPLTKAVSSERRQGGGNELISLSGSCTQAPSGRLGLRCYCFVLSELSCSFLISPAFLPSLLQKFLYWNLLSWRTSF